MTLRKGWIGGGAVGLSFVLLCLSLTSAQDRAARPRTTQANPVAAPAESDKAPETFLPAEPHIYFAWDGETAHHDAWEKTAAYQALQESGLVPVATKMFADLVARSTGEQEAVFDRVLQTAKENGISLAITTPTAEGLSIPWGVIVLHNGAELGPQISGLVQQIAQPQSGIFLKTETRAGRDISILNFQQFPPAEIGWWTEGGHLVVAAGNLAVDSALAVIDGKEKNITTSRLWKANRSGKQPFEANMLAWLDTERLFKTVGPIPLPLNGPQSDPVPLRQLLQAAGVDGVKSYVYRSGYDGVATVSEARVEMNEDRQQGIGQLILQKPITLDALPPLPAQISSFGAASFDFSTWYDVVAGIIDRVTKFGPPEAKQQMDAAFAQAHEALGLDVKSDLLEPLGNVLCVYNDSGQGPLILGLTVAISVDDAKKLRSSIDTLLDRAARQLPPKMLNIRRTEKRGASIVTLEIAEAVANPSFVVTDDWFVISIVPQTLETFLLRADGKLPTWKPAGELAKAIEGLPKEFTSLTISDPRESYRLVAGLAPIVLPILRKVAKASNPDAPIEIPVAVADLPPAETVVEPLFPNVAVTYIEGNTLVRHSRSSLPGFIGGDSGAAGVATAAVAVALILPAVQQARQAARRTQSKNNLKQIMLALHNYHDAMNSLPAGTVETSARDPKERLSWMTSLLPYLEEDPLYSQLDQNQPWNKGANEEVARKSIPTFLNPALPEGQAGEPAKTHYVGIAGVGKDGPNLPVTSPKAGMFAYNRATRFADIHDGLSNTMTVTEATAQSTGPWTRGGEATLRALTKQPYVNGPDGIGGPYTGGFNAALGDGSVRFLSTEIDPKVLEAISTIRGGETVGDF